MPNILVVVPCGKAKVWDSRLSQGPVSARTAYTGSPFVVNKAYAEHFGTCWRILSAKYGLLLPDAEIEQYNVSFKEPKTRPITVEGVREQIHAQQLHEVDLVIGLGGKDYRAVIQAAFASWPVPVHFPFAGLPLGLGMQAIKAAIAADNLEPATVAGRGGSPT